MPLLARLVAEIFASLCPLPAEPACPTAPVTLMAELLAETEGPVTVTWQVDGRPVASDQVELEAFAPRKVALQLVPQRPGHWVALAVAGPQGQVRHALALPAACFFLLELAGFSPSHEGLELTVANSGPAPSLPLPFRWSVNGLPLSESRLDPLPAGGRAQLVLPAKVHPLLARVLQQPGAGKRKDRRGVPVVVSVTFWPGPGDLEAPVKQWSFFLGRALLGWEDRQPGRESLEGVARP